MRDTARRAFHEQPAVSAFYKAWIELSSSSPSGRSPGVDQGVASNSGIAAPSGSCQIFGQQRYNPRRLCYNASRKNVSTSAAHAARPFWHAAANIRTGQAKHRTALHSRSTLPAAHGAQARPTRAGADAARFGSSPKFDS